MDLGTIVGCGMLLVGAVDTKIGLLIIGVVKGRTIEIPATLDVLEKGPNPRGIYRIACRHLDRVRHICIKIVSD